MSVIKVLRDLNGLFNYSTDENPTSQQDYQKAVKNWVKTIVSLVDSNLWQPETEYTVGSQLLTPSLPYYVLRCTVAGTSGAAEPDYTDVALDDEITDGTVTWVVEKLATTEFVNANAGLPVGFQYFQTTPNVPAGSLPLLGGEYSRTTYADLWAWVQTQSGYLIEESAWQAKAASNGGNVPFYSKGDGSTTFRVPALKCWVRGANSINEVGGYLAAGLPNITGGFCVETYYNKNGTGDGAFNLTLHDPPGNGIISNDDSRNYANMTFDASRSNSIYGKSSTVQPESIVGMWVVKAYGTVTNVGSTDVSAIAQGLTEAETRISTAALTGVVQAFAGRTMPQGWLLCDGSAVSRTDYAALFAVIGTTYGTGDGSTTFNLPNLVNRMVVGSGSSYAIAATGGEESVTLSMKQIPKHHFSGTTSTSGSHNHWFASARDTSHSDRKNTKYEETGDFNRTRAWLKDDYTGNAGEHSHTFTTNTLGGDQPHNNMPPYLALRYIIKY